jgi:hypothetical protein
MSENANKLYSFFKQWYRSPKYCSHNNIINGLAHSFIIKNGYSEDAITELENNNIIEKYGIGYRMTEIAIVNHMNYQH